MRALHSICRVLTWGALGGVLATACSSGSVNQPDPYYGFIDSTALPLSYQPVSGSACPPGVSLCYAPQLGYAKGQSFYFYNFGAVPTSKLQATLAAPISPSVVTTTVYTFPNGCLSGPGFDPQENAYPQTVQYPVFSTLPDGGTGPSSPPTLPLVNVATVGGATTETCNDIKAASSIGPSVSQTGNFGAYSTPTNTVSLWPVVDVSAAFVPKNSLFAVEQFAWYKGLQLESVSGGDVPSDAAGNLLPMDGVILDPPVPTGNSPLFAKVTDAKALLFAFTPGEKGYSPMVRLWDYTYDINQPLGTLTGICHGNSQACTVSQVDIDKLLGSAGGKVPLNTLFIVASPQ